MKPNPNPTVIGITQLIARCLNRQVQILTKLYIIHRELTVTEYIEHKGGSKFSNSIQCINRNSQSHRQKWFTEILRERVKTDL